MPRTHGYSAKGQRCHGTADWHPSKRTNVIGAMLGKVLLTVTLFEANIDAAIFNGWMEKDLIPKLPKNSVLIMDNAAFHKSPKLKSMIEDAGHRLEYLPAYSPDLNPIERCWNQAKSRRKKWGCDIETLFREYMDIL